VICLLKKQQHYLTLYLRNINLQQIKLRLKTCFIKLRLNPQSHIVYC